jgi:CheY-like chemotaxis protein
LAVQAPRSLTVLLVEDDAAVRQVTRLFLEGCGGHVLEAGDSVEAFRLWQSHRETVDLLVVDLVIPGQVDGLQLADRLRTERPGLKVVLTTGFMDESLAAELNATQGVEFLFKPYTCAQIEGVLARLRGNHLAQVPPPGPAK